MDIESKYTNISNGYIGASPLGGERISSCCNQLRPLASRLQSYFAADESVHAGARKRKKLATQLSHERDEKSIGTDESGGKGAAVTISRTWLRI